MDEAGLLATVSRLMEAEAGDLTCDQPGHPDGHACLLLSDFCTVPEDEFDRRYPGAYWNGEPPMAVPDGYDWDGAWVHGMRAVVSGQDADANGIVAVAERTIPEPVDPPAELSWVERLVAVTGGPPPPVPAPDWAAVESRLGASLPSDYKRLH